MLFYFDLTDGAVAVIGGCCLLVRFISGRLRECGGGVADVSGVVGGVVQSKCFIDFQINRAAEAAVAAAAAAASAAAAAAMYSYNSRCC